MRPIQSQLPLQRQALVATAPRDLTVPAVVRSPEPATRPAPSSLTTPPVADFDPTQAFRANPAQALSSLAPRLTGLSASQQAAFASQFDQLPPSEQQRTLVTDQILLQQPPPADLNAQVYRQLDQVPSPPDRGMGIGRALNTLGLYLPPRETGSVRIEDASNRLNTVYMSGNQRETAPGYFSDMQQIGRQEGFAVERLDTGNPWVEDYLDLRNNEVQTLPDVDNALKASQGYRGEYTAMQGLVSRENNSNRAPAATAALGVDTTTTQTYNEGGNLLTGTLPNGEPYGIIGQDGLVISTFALAQRYDAAPASVPAYAPEQIASRLTQLGLNQPETELSETQRNQIADTQTRLVNSGTLAAGDPQARERTLEFMARMDITQDLFASDLGIARENLSFVSQPDFHIDMYMRPLAPGQIMINDFDANEALLQDALGRSEPGSLEAQELTSMLANNQRDREARGPRSAEIVQQLRDRGFEVIPAPGVFAGQMAPPVQVPGEPLNPAILVGPQTRHANFMNGISATRPGTNQQIYLTNHTSLPSLRAAYADFARDQLGFDTLYWVGAAGGSMTTLSAAEESLKGRGGLDCQTR